MLTELRKSIIDERKRFTIDVKQYRFTSKKLTINAVNLIRQLGVSSVMLYLPIGGEADVTGITTLPLRFYIPVTHGVTIRPARYNDKTPLKRGEFGVMVPVEPEFADKRCIDLVIVPAVAVDRDKNRMGYGKGCYDRFLADMDCVKAAACYDFQIVNELEPRPHDVKMDYIITESGCF